MSFGTEDGGWFSDGIDQKFEDDDGPFTCANNGLWSPAADDDVSWYLDGSDHKYEDDDGPCSSANNGSYSSARFLDPSMRASCTSCTATGAASTKLKTGSIRRMQATILYRNILVRCHVDYMVFEYVSC